MDVYTFRRHDSVRGFVGNVKGSESTRRTINFRNGEISISGLLAKELNVKHGSHLAFTVDESKPEHIYVRRADDEDDTKDIQFRLAQQRRTKNMLHCWSAAVSRHVLQQVGATRSCTCYVTPTPTNINGKDHYQILVSCPILIN